MLTRCPQCFAWFRIRAEHLSVANGLVTCGRCDHVFNALTSLIEESAARPPPAPPRIEMLADAGAARAADEAQVLAEAQALAEAPASTPAPFKFVSIVATPSVTPSRAGAPATVVTTVAAHSVSAPPSLSLQTLATVVTESAERHNDAASTLSADDLPFVDTSAFAIDLPPIDAATDDIDIGPISTEIDDLDISDFDFSAVDNDEPDLKAAEIDSTDPKFREPANELATSISPLPLIVAHDGDVSPTSDAALIDRDLTGPPPAPDPPSVLLDDLAALHAAPRPSAWRSVAWALFGLMLTAVAALQVTFIERQPLLVQVPAAAWVIDRLCERLPCLERRQAASSVRLLARDVREHPSYRDALLVNATIVNDAKTPSPYPVIDLRLRDAAGNVLAARQFQPAEYLDQSIALAAGMPAERPVYIVLELAGSASNAVSFEFTFL